MHLDVAAQTDIGRRKKSNEDYYAIFREDTPDLQVFDEGALLCVADGLGGHTSGEIASKLAVKVFVDILRHAKPETGEEADLDNGYLPLIESYIKAANAQVFQTNQDLVKDGKPMGTTLLSGLITPSKVFFGNVGDSRAYHFRDGEIIDKTEDHSWVDEQVKLGLMSKAEAQIDARKNFVTRSIGTHSEVEVDMYRWNIIPGDWLLLCTDGLINMVPEADIKQHFRNRDSAPVIASKLVALANENGGKDNITVIVVHVSPSFFQRIYFRVRDFVRAQGLKLLWLIVTFFFGAAAFLAGLYAGQNGLVELF